jgi:hypothetical protein
MIPVFTWGSLGKRRCRKWISGRDIPTASRVRKKKKSQRGPRVGSVANIRISNPRNPAPARIPLSVKIIFVLGNFFNFNPASIIFYPVF